MAADKLSCKEAVSLVTEYLEKTLLPATQAQFEQHVVDCPGCQTYLEQIQQTIDMLRRLADEPMFPETRQQLLQIFQTWKQTPHTGN
ncbi:MAG TPA: anti-sigma factor [Ktedonobacterales bacterium]